MFVVSLKFSRRQILSFAMVVLVSVFAVAAIIAAPSVAEMSASVLTPKAETTEQRVMFLKNLGYEVGEGEEVREICLPDEADATLTQYETVQKQAAMTLEPYYGKRVRLYTYSILNAGEEAVAHVYIYRGRIVAGDIMSARADGFCLPLTSKE